MKLNIGIATRDRHFSKSMRRVSPQLNDLEAMFESVVMRDPLQKSTMIIVTDENAAGTLEEVKNNEGIFQGVAGCPRGLSDDELRLELSKIVRATVEASSFSDPDREAFIKVIEAWDKKSP